MGQKRHPVAGQNLTAEFSNSIQQPKKTGALRRPLDATDG
jgi:hypothetical protein